MTVTQESIAISLFVFEALLFHTLFCNWMAGDPHRRSVNSWAGRSPDHSGLIVSIGPAGIYARGYQTVEFDAAIPLKPGDGILASDDHLDGVADDPGRVAAVDDPVLVGELLPDAQREESL